MGGKANHGPGPKLILPVQTINKPAPGKILRTPLHDTTSRGPASNDQIKPGVLLPRRSILLGSLSAIALSYCDKPPESPIRPFWRPGYMLRPDGSALGASPVCVGFNSVDQMSRVGVDSFFDSIGSIPADLIARELRLGRVLCGFLSTIFDFSASGSNGMLSDFVMMFMTKKSFWPNGVFAHNAGKAEGIQIVDTNNNVTSDCDPYSTEAPCQINDLLCLNNKKDIFPGTDSYGSLTQDEADALVNSVDSLGCAISEEMLHARQRHVISGSDHAMFVSDIMSLWDASSGGQNDDQKLADAWTKGFIARCLCEEGIKDYPLRGAIQQALRNTYPISELPYYDVQMEVAIISVMQLIGCHAEAFIGSYGSSYLGKYSQEEPGNSYMFYQSLFIDRELYAQIGRYDYDIRPAFPSFLSGYYEPFVTRGHLDQRLSYGFQNPIIGQNPYLSDAGSLAIIAKLILPKVLNP